MGKPNDHRGSRVGPWLIAGLMPRFVGLVDMLLALLEPRSGAPRGGRPTRSSLALGVGRRVVAGL